jgi:hypothetical protein
MKKFLHVAIVLLLSTPAFAIDFDTVLKNADGSSMKTDKGVEPTLSSICKSALVASYRDEVDPTGKETITPAEKYARWKLAGRLHGNVDLSPGDLALIKKLVGKAYSPSIMGPAWEVLDPSLSKDQK